jgi:hypothetical protein
MATIKNVMAELQVEIFKKAMKKKRYRFFDSNLSYNLNIIGVRKKNNLSNDFDDNINVIYRNDEGEWEVFTAAATTDPGKTSLFKPLNRKGT